MGISDCERRLSHGMPCVISAIVGRSLLGSLLFLPFLLLLLLYPVSSRPIDPSHFNTLANACVLA